MAKDRSITLSKPPKDEMCPPGNHIVRGHERICHSGTRTWVDTHTIKNYHSWDSQGEAYAKSVERLYQKSKKRR